MSRDEPHPRWNFKYVLYDFIILFFLFFFFKENLFTRIFEKFSFDYRKCNAFNLILGWNFFIERSKRKGIFRQEIRSKEQKIYFFHSDVFLSTEAINSFQYYFNSPRSVYKQRCKLSLYGWNIHTANLFFMSFYDWNINVPCVRTHYMGCRRVSANDTTPPVRLGLSTKNCLCFCAGSTHVSKAVPPQRAGKKQGRDRQAGFPSVTAASPSESRRDEELDENYLIRRSQKGTNLERIPREGSRVIETRRFLDKRASIVQHRSSIRFEAAS